MSDDSITLGSGGVTLAGSFRDVPSPVAAALAGPRGYPRQVRERVSPEVLELIAGWVTRHWGQA